MSDDTNDLNASERAQINANLRLAAQFIQELIDRPEQHDSLPESGTIVLLPGDDPGDSELSRANIAMAQQLAAEGQHVITWVVGMPALSGPQILPRWPLTRGAHSGITYDRHQDTLTVVLSRPERPTLPVRVHPRATVLIDPETRMAHMLTIPTFLAEVAPKSLALFDLLLLPATELMGITRDEVRSLRKTLAHGRPRAAPEQVTVSQIVEELSRLTA